MIHWEMCKKFKFDHTNKWYMHNPASVHESDSLHLLWDFDIQTDHIISTRRPDLIIINNNNKKRTWKFVDFVVPADHRVKLKESEKKDKYLALAREWKKSMEHEGDDYTKRDWCFWYSHQRIIKGTRGLGGWRTWRPSKLQYYWEWPEYCEESWRLEETCCHSNSSEKPSAKTCEKLSMSK